MIKAGKFKNLAGRNWTQRVILASISAPMLVGSHIATMLNSNEPAPTSSRSQFLIRSVLFYLAFLLAHIFGVLMMTNNISPIWPATGVGISILLIYGTGYWPSIALAAITSHLLRGNSMDLGMAITLASTLECIVGARLIHYIYQKQNKNFAHGASVAIIVGVLVVSSACAIVGVTALCIAGKLSWSSFPHNYFTWMSGNFLGGALLIPYILSCYTPQENKSIPKLNSIGLLGSAFALGYFLLLRDEGSPFVFLIFPFLLWCFIEMNDRSAKLSVVLLCFAALLSTRMGYGPFYYGNINTNTMNLQILFWGVSLSSLILSDFKFMNTIRIARFILLFGWLISGLIFYTCYSLDRFQVKETFHNSVDEVVNNLNYQMQAYSTALRSGVGLISASNRVERHEWKKFVSELNLNQIGTGMTGLGIVNRIDKTKLKEFILQRRREGSPDFNVRPLKDPNHESTEAFVVAYTEPYEINKTAEGLDFATEWNRYSAAALAADTGQITITQSLGLTTDLQKKPAFLMFYPFYSKGPDPLTLDERRERNLGWVAAPVFIRDFFANSLKGKTFTEISYSVTEPETNSLLANSNDFFKLSDVYLTTRFVRIANRSYIMNFKPTVVFVENSTTTASWAGIAASLLALLLSTITTYIQLDKKRATQLVEERTQQLEMTGRMASLGGWEFDTRSRRLHWSKYTRELHGIPDDYEVDLDKALSFYKEGRSREKISEAVRLCVEEGTPFDLELELVTIQGQDLWVRALGKAQIENGKIVRIFGAIQNITERLQLEREKTLIMESLKLGIWKYKPSTDSLFWDRNMFALFDVDPATFTGKLADWEALLEDDSKEEAARDLQMALSGQKSLDTCYRIKTPSGHPRFIGVRGIVIRDESNQAIKLYGINWDKTNEILLEHQLLQERAKTLQASKLASLGEMSAGIAHEINNPLAIISGSVELMTKYVERPDKILEKIEIIKKATERINRIVSGLRKFSRSSDGSVYSEHRLSDIIRESVSLTEIKARRNDTALISDIRSNALIRCDNFEIEQVIINLVNNAIDAVKKQNEKWVKVECFDDKQDVVLRVSDSGSGISEKCKNRIFDPFYTTKDVGEGTGLGLSISKGILDDHKASISLVSNLSHTCFEIRFERAIESSSHRSQHV